MNIKQVYVIVNNIATQMYGDTAVQVTDLNGLISLGNDVLSSNTSTDKFLNTLVDRIGKTIISMRAYSSDAAALINDAFTFGAILQKIYVAPIQASQSSQWDLTSGASVDQYVIAKPTVKQKLFSTRTTWECDITIPDFQLSSAFQSAEQMAAFIDAIFLAIRNSMEIYIEGMSEMCYANMIGERIVHTKLQNGKTAIDLLASYNALMSTSLTTPAAMISTDFLKYASMVINMTTKRIAKMSSVYNSEGYKRFTPPDRLRVSMLADFAAACASYLQANTYHDELVKLPRYTEVMYWQGLGQTPVGFDATSKVAVRTADGYTLMQPYVVCMLSDEEAIGLTYDNRRSKSAYNSKGEYTNFFEKADIGYFNDLSENAIIFTVGALAVPTLSYAATLQQAFSKAAPADLSNTITLNGSDTIASTKVNGTAITAAQGTVTANVVKILASYLSTLTTDTVVPVTCTLASGAVIEYYITVGA